VNIEFLKKIWVINYILISFFIFGCKKNTNQIKKPEKIPSLEILYNSAFNLYEEGDWKSSIQLYQKVETRYSFSEWAPRATLMIIYMQYETSNYVNALENIEKFKKLYPTNKNVEYVDFIKGLIFYEQVNVVSKDQTYTQAALNQFRKVINDYPDTIYAIESKYKIDLLNEQLAGKEMYIARYYMRKSKWVSAIKRLNTVLAKYETTIYSEEALHRLVEVYYKLGNIKEAKKYAAILGYNFNKSDWYKKTYKIVADKNYNIENKKVRQKLRDKIKKLIKFSND